MEPFPELASRPTILHVRTQAFSTRVSPFIRQTILGLQPYFHNVVLTPSTDGQHPPELSIEELQIADLRRPFACHKIASYLREKYPSIRLVMGHFGNGMRSGRLLAELLGVPLLGAFGGSDVNVELMNPALRDQYLSLFEIPSAHFLAVAGYLRDKLIDQGVPASRLFTWHRGVNVDAFPVVARPPAEVARLVICARFLEVKGHEYAIRALTTVRASGRRAELTMLGDGPLRAPLAALARELGIADAVQFAGHVSHDEVVAHLRAGDIYLQPSVTCGEGRTEGVPNAIMEAHATAMPVVATDHGGIGEVVLDGQTGFLVPERDPDALADRIGRLIDDRELRLRMGLRGRAHVEQEFHLQVQSRRLAGRILHTIHAGELFDARGWSRVKAPAPLDTSRSAVTAAPRKRPVDGQALYDAMKDPPFKVGGRLVKAYKRAVWTVMYRPYLKFIGREIARYVSAQLADQLGSVLEITTRGPSVLPPLAGARRASDDRGELVMSSALCLDCPHCSATARWPDAPCPMDAGCLEALQREFVAVTRLAAPVPRGAGVVLTDADVGAGERLPYEDGSLPALTYRGDLQRVTDVARFFRELRRVLAADGTLALVIEPMPLGRDGARLLGELAIPFAQHFFSRAVLEAFLGVPIREPRRFDAADLQRWLREAGLSIVAHDRPDRIEDPCEMHVQARFAPLFRRAGLTRAQLAGRYAVRVRRAAVAAIADAARLDALTRA